MENIVFVKSKFYNTIFSLFFITYLSGIYFINQLFLYLILGICLLVLNVLFLFANNFKLLLNNFIQINVIILLFLIVILATMSYRGIEFNFLGGKMEGGMFYVRIIAVILLYLTSIRIKTNNNFYIYLFLFFFLSSILPFLSDLLFLLAGPNNSFSKFVEGSTTIKEYSENFQNGGLFRIQSAAILADSILFLIIAFYPFTNHFGNFKFKWKHFLLFILLFILIGISGHRLALFNLFFVISIFYVFTFGIKKIRKLLYISLLFIISFLILVYIFYNQFPSPIQRVFSFLPFLSDTAIISDAEASNNFRFLMLIKGFSMIPDYFIIGKGFSFTNYNIDFSDYFGTIDQFSEIGVFHNGLMGLIVNLGIFGFILGLYFLFKTLKIVSSKNIFISSNNIYNRIYILLRVKIFITILTFIFLYGDLQTNFIDLIVLLTFYKNYSYFYVNVESNLNLCAA